MTIPPWALQLWLCAIYAVGIVGVCDWFAPLGAWGLVVWLAATPVLFAVLRRVRAFREIGG